MFIKLGGLLVALFYLDSFDCDWKSPEQSAQHHLKELVSIKKKQYLFLT